MFWLLPFIGRWSKITLPGLIHVYLLDISFLISDLQARGFDISCDPIKIALKGPLNGALGPVSLVLVKL